MSRAPRRYLQDWDITVEVVTHVESAALFFNRSCDWGRGFR